MVAVKQGLIAVLFLFCHVILSMSWAISPQRSAYTCSPLQRSFRRFPAQLDMAIQSIDLEAGTNDQDEDVDIESVTDAEALLACRAYLQRKNRLGEWTQSRQRKQRREQAAKDLQDSSWDSDSTGFFWENPSELKHFQHRNLVAEGFDAANEMNEGDVEDQDDDDDDGDDNLWENLSPRRINHRVEYDTIDEDQEEEDLRLQTLEDFSAFDDLEPSASHVKRSQAAKRMWSDPVWKARWYEQRWGNGSKRTTRATKQARLLEKRVSFIQPDAFLAKEELMNLSGEDIADAIRTYVLSKRRRSNWQTQNLKKRKDILEKRKNASEAHTAATVETPIPRDVLFTQEPEALREVQRHRSEIAKKTYARRLENKANVSTSAAKNKSKAKPKSAAVRDTRSLAIRKASFSPALTPRDALLRIQIDLEEAKLPNTVDVQLILEPTKMGQRKDVLRRILSDHFDLRGKCVPVDLGHSKEDLLFATQCSIEQLGAFVLYTVRSNEGNDKENANKT